MNESTIDKIIIPVAECTPGMTLMQSIVDENTGVVIASKGQKLTAENIERLRNFEHTQIWISLNNIETDSQESNGVSESSQLSEQSLWEIGEEKLQAYKEYAQVLKVILSEMQQNKKLSIKKIMDLADQMFKDFKDYYSMLGCMNLLLQMEYDDTIHSIHIACCAFILGKWLEYDEMTLKNIIVAGLLHDVGKIDFSNEIVHNSLKKMDTLQKLEYKRHPILGYEKLVPYNELSIEVLKGVLTHHERCDGSGYPLALKANKIENIARVIGIVDTFCRVKQTHHIFDTIKILQIEMSSQFETSMLNLFCNNIINYYVGAKVILNTGEFGEVAFIQSQAMYNPIIKVGNEYVNLQERRELKIVRVLE